MIRYDTIICDNDTINNDKKTIKHNKETIKAGIEMINYYKEGMNNDNGRLK